MLEGLGVGGKRRNARQQGRKDKKAQAGEAEVMRILPSAAMAQLQH